MKLKTIVALVSGAVFLTGCSSAISKSSDNQTEAELRSAVNESFDKSVKEIREALTRLENRQMGKRAPAEPVKPSPLDTTVARTKTAPVITTPPKVAVATTPVDVKGKVVATPATTTATAVKAKVVEKKDIVKKEVATKPVVDKTKVEKPKQTRQQGGSLDQRINLNWQGEASDLLRSLSRKLGYAFTETGEKHKIPVSVSASDRTVRDVLGMIDGQTGKKANIIVSSGAKNITLQYK